MFRRYRTKFGMTERIKVKISDFRFLISNFKPIFAKCQNEEKEEHKKDFLIG